VRYRLEVRLTPADVGSRVVIRWRRPAGPGAGVDAGSAGGGSAAGGAGEAGGAGDEIADVLGILQAADDACFTVRKASGDVVIIPRERALAGKAVPPPARRSRPVQPGEGMPHAPPQR
jgi:hypothetical protein